MTDQEHRKQSSKFSPATRFVVAGLLFSVLWASASAAGKIGIQSVEPLVLFNIRFLLAGMIILCYAHVIAKYKLPQRADWKPLLIFGSLNTTIYLSLYIIALKQVSAGIGSLAPATNPLLISILSAAWVGSKVKPVQWLSIVLGMGGVALATFPLLRNSTATVPGLLLMMLSMLCYSIGTIYYAKTNWRLPTLVINGWQVLIGGILLLPFTMFLHHPNYQNHFDLRFWAAEAWLILPVSIVSVQLWLFLLKENAVRASLWLFLCPPFGFVYASFLLHEPITSYTIAGTALVITGLYLGQRQQRLQTLSGFKS